MHLQGIPKKAVKRQDFDPFGAFILNHPSGAFFLNQIGNLVGRGRKRVELSKRPKTTP
jgi:hypothetical protein